MIMSNANSGLPIPPEDTNQGVQPQSISEDVIRAAMVRARQEESGSRKNIVGRAIVICREILTGITQSTVDQNM